MPGVARLTHHTYPTYTMIIKYDGPAEAEGQEQVVHVGAVQVQLRVADLARADQTEQLHVCEPCASKCSNGWRLARRTRPLLRVAASASW